MDYTKVVDLPVPVWFAKLTADGTAPCITDGPILDLMVRHQGGVTFRGIAGSRLTTVLSAGIDVNPTNSVIYCAEVDKAFEYGGPDKVILALRYFQPSGGQILKRAVAHIVPDTTPNDADALRAAYPYEIGRTNGTVRLCRVAPDSHARLECLRNFGYFIDGNPWDALVGIFVLSTTRAGHTAGAQAVIDCVQGSVLSSPESSNATELRHGWHEPIRMPIRVTRRSAF